MATWTDSWKIVTPATRKSIYQPAQTVTLRDNGVSDEMGFAAYTSSNWYSNLLRHAESRAHRYRQYSQMDFGLISRALDITAEEISNPDKKTDLPFIIDYQIEDSQDISPNTTTTLRAALRQWAHLHQLNKRSYFIARNLIKHGDVFFRKTSDTKPWQFIHPARVIAIEINPLTQEVKQYHVKKTNFEVNSSVLLTGVTKEIDIIPADGIIHFSLSDDMSEVSPFGTSVLASAYRDFQKLVMLEDAAVIYRIVRAPERRVFYIDVGNTPQQKVKQYLSSIIQDIKQRRTPNAQNSAGADGQYNPESISEDFFFPTTAGGRGSRVETLPGGTTWETPELDHFQDKVLSALRIPSSYMRNSTTEGGGGTYNDGKVGVAYMEEYQFTKYIMRMQRVVEGIFDEQFKLYLEATGISVDHEIFDLKLPEPQNFSKYRQAALDADMITSFKAVADTPYLSPKFAMARFLGMTQDEIQINEDMITQERGLKDIGQITVLQQIYDPAVYENREAISLADQEKEEEDLGKLDDAAAPGDESAK